MSQDRLDKDVATPATSTTGNAIYQAPDIEATLTRATKAVSKVRVVHGANEQYFDNLEGKTVGTVRKSLREVFNIPGDADALINGKTVGDDFVLEGGQNLEFVKEAGVKGGKKARTVDEVYALVDELRSMPDHTFGGMEFDDAILFQAEMKRRLGSKYGEYMPFFNEFTEAEKQDRIQQVLSEVRLR